MDVNKYNENPVGFETYGIRRNRTLSWIEVEKNESRDLFRIYTKNGEGLYAGNSSWLFSRLNSYIPQADSLASSIVPTSSMFLFLPPFFPSHSFFLTCSLCTFRDSRRSTIASWRLVKDHLTLCVSFAFLSASLIKRKEKGRERKWWTREEDSGIRIVSSGDKRYFFWGGSRWNKLFPSLCCFFLWTFAESW